MKIFVDAMGGDFAPQAPVAGAIEALRRYPGIEVVLAGVIPEIEKHLVDCDDVRSRITLLDAPEVITNDESPVMGVRRKTNSATVKGMLALRDKEVDGFVSAGSTGAVLAGMAGCLYGLNMTTVTAVDFDYNMSIEILVIVVLGGIGSIRGSVIAAAALTLLPELLRSFSTYRMLVYAIVLILVMLATNSPILKNLWAKITLIPAVQKLLKKLPKSRKAGDAA